MSDIDRTPIDPEDIKTGDLVRWEKHGSDEAHEFRRGVRGALAGGGTYYLLDRASDSWKRGDELWLTEDHYPWRKGDRIVLAKDWPWSERTGHTIDPGMLVSRNSVTRERPENVPAAALERLRAKYRDGYDGKTMTAAKCWQLDRLITDFLAAVDEPT